MKYRYRFFMLMSKPGYDPLDANVLGIEVAT
jgi:hypothetical protein